MDTPSSIKGFTDLFSPESDVFTHMERCARETFFRYGFKELRTPILEHTELFCRSIGTETDVVQKEMYTFPDRKDRSLTMRPEATAGVMRAYIENRLHTRESVSKLFTCGPMFRYERPQKGRMRQFHQLNCECLGPVEPTADAEMISMLMQFLQTLGITATLLKINSLGCAKCRPIYRDLLRDWIKTLDTEALCTDCRRRLETNPLRVLDCKEAGCKALTVNAPHLVDNTCPDCREHFAVVLQLLDKQKINYELDHRLVRGLDYYSRTTFEVLSADIGAQGSIAGGGRYDGLISQLGGPEVAGIGFACGMERLALLLPPLAPVRPHFYMAVLDDNATEQAFALTQDLRQANLSGEMSFGRKSVKAVMRQADKSAARFCLLLGENEMAEGSVMVKNMDSGEQNHVPQKALVSALQAAL